MCNGSVSPAFIQKAGRHKKMESTLLYMNPSISTALRTSDLLCGNKEGGWSEKLVGRKDSLDPFLDPSQVKETVDSSSANIQPPAPPLRPVRPPGPPLRGCGRGRGRGRGRTVTAPPRGRPVAGLYSSGQSDSVNSESQDGDSVAQGINKINNLALLGSISISLV